MDQPTANAAQAAKGQPAFFAAVMEINGMGTKSHTNAVLETLTGWSQSADRHCREANIAVQFDIPRKLWMDKLANAGQNPEIAANDHFIVGHVLLSCSARPEPIQAGLRQLIKQFGFTLLFESTRPSWQKNSLFWQVAMLPSDVFSLSDRLFRLAVAMERQTDVRVASLSHLHVIYEANTVDELRRDLDVSHPFFASSAAFAYTQTADAPHGYRRLGAAGLLVDGGETSASSVETLVYDNGYSLLEAAALVLTPETVSSPPRPYSRCIVASLDHEAIWLAETEGALWRTESLSRIFITTEPYGDNAEPLPPGRPLALVRSAAGSLLWLEGTRFRQEVNARLSNRRTPRLPVVF
ncbi:class II glutamine amidotransferase domain-containing protein [Geobacillus icigianus]|nr:glutamate synthase [Geobacillus icigianus]